MAAAAAAVPIAHQAIAAGGGGAASGVITGFDERKQMDMLIDVAVTVGALAGTPHSAGATKAPSLPPSAFGSPISSQQATHREQQTESDGFKGSLRSAG